jgi:hypothetical protein
VKHSLTGIICTCLALSAWTVPVRAQEPQTPPQTEPSQAPAQTQPDQTQPGQTQPPQTPPAQTPPAQNPAGQAPTSTPGAPATPSGIRQTSPPPLPKFPDVRQPGESGWFIGVDGWFPPELPWLDKGHGSSFTNPSKIQFQGKPNIAEGVEAGIALGLHNMLRISYFDSKAAGSVTTPQNITVLDQTYSAGWLVSTNYRIQTGKISFEYLTWPYPVESRKFRLKTLWQVQFVNFRAAFDAPLEPLTDSNGNPLVDSSGNPISYAAQASRFYFTPSLGLGTYYYPSRHFRLEMNASGFDIPHHTAIWDVDASLNIRVISHLEIRIGAKGFHFKTSVQAPYFQYNTMASGFVGLRWYSEQ